MTYNEKMHALGSNRSVIREIAEYSNSRAAEIGAENVFDFSIGNPSTEPPRAVTEALVELLQTKAPMSLHSYTSAQGDVTVRRAIAENIKKEHGFDISPDLIYMTCGAAASLAISLRALVCEGEEVVLLAPFFTEYTVYVENAGGVPVVSQPRESDLQIDIDDLARCITPRTRAIIVNSPNNPSGVVYTDETLRALCALLRERSKAYGAPIYLIADEPYRALVYDGVKVPFLMSYYPDTIVCYSYSKALSLPGERIGYIAVSPQMSAVSDVWAAIFGAGRALGYICAPSLFQHLIARVANVHANVEPYRENRDLLYNALVSYGYKCVRPDGAFYLFVRTPERDAAAFCERAKRHELLFVPCDDFGVTGYVRIAYCVPRERIERALPAFKALLDEYQSE